MPRQYGMDTWLLTCTGSQVAPLSVLEKISRGVMVNSVLGGPTVIARLWMSGSVTPLVTASHVLPPSLERNSAEGLVPAKIMLGSTGSMARAQMGISFMGESSRSQCSPLSSLRYTPLSAPQYMIRASLGC